jgi:hypothetical protein
MIMVSLMSLAATHGSTGAHWYAVFNQAHSGCGRLVVLPVYRVGDDEADSHCILQPAHVRVQVSEF